MLGQLLFLIYTNDIVRIVQSINIQDNKTLITKKKSLVGSRH